MANDSDYPTPTTRRVHIVGGPWPERHGCEGVLCNPPASGCYPQPSKGEVLVLLDDDPIKPGVFMGIDYAEARAHWSCCLSEKHMEYVR